MSVERLTMHRTWEEASEDLRNELGYKYIWMRLNQIEDILGDTYDLDRLRELVEADKAERCVVLPCKRGDILWTFCNYPNKKVYSFKVTDLSTLNGRTMLNTDILSVVDSCDIGKTVFLTRESAEAALAKEADHE